MCRLKKEPTKFSNKSCRNFCKVPSQQKNDRMGPPDNLKIQLLWRRTYSKIMNSVKRVVQSVQKLQCSFTHGDATKMVNSPFPIIKQLVSQLPFEDSEALPNKQPQHAHTLQSSIKMARFIWRDRCSLGKQGYQHRSVISVNSIFKIQ